MHKKYAKDGFVAVSVSLDEPADAKARASGLRFLAKQGATFANLLLDETPEFYQTKLKIDGPPCVYLFNRDNRFVLKHDGSKEGGLIDYALFEKRIVALLAEKQ